jgi:hypothetical protein
MQARPRLLGQDHPHGEMLFQRYHVRNHNVPGRPHVHLRRRNYRFADAGHLGTSDGAEEEVTCSIYV